MTYGKIRRCHIVGVAGAGMSALAQFYAMDGAKVTGSDRIFDAGGGEDTRRRLEKVGVTIVPQDGSGVVHGLDYVVFSTAVEQANADLARARQLGIEIKHRSDCLQNIVAGHKTVVVAGTSGKSTVTAMIWEILSAALGRVSVVTGGPIVRLRDDGVVGNAFNANSEVLVVEGDESDGTLVKYDAPFVSVLLNLSKDHKELDELQTIFGDFLRRSSSIRIFADADNLARFRTPAFYAEASRKPEIVTFGFVDGDLRAEQVELTAQGSRFVIDGVKFALSIPGRHNVFNALAAVSAIRAFDLSTEAAVAPLHAFRGVYRRFQQVGECDGIRVVDDFAHNPEKIRAAISAAQLSGARVLAVYQPHGIFPTRFLKPELVAAFRESLRPQDRLWLPDIYNVGPPDTSISSADVVNPLVEAGCGARYVAKWDAICAEIAAEARAGDLVLVMGARDPALPERARDLFRAIATSQVKHRPPS